MAQSITLSWHRTSPKISNISEETTQSRVSDQRRLHQLRGVCLTSSHPTFNVEYWCFIECHSTLCCYNLSVLYSLVFVGRISQDWRRGNDDTTRIQRKNTEAFEIDKEKSQKSELDYLRNNQFHKRCRQSLWPTELPNRSNNGVGKIPTYLVLKLVSRKKLVSTSSSPTSASSVRPVAGKNWEIHSTPNLFHAEHDVL